MKEWRSKCSQIADNQDELVDHLRDIEVMEEQLQEYSNINASLQNTIEEMTPTMILHSISSRGVVFKYEREHPSN
jgi:hypothetical protein